MRAQATPEPPANGDRAAHVVVEPPGDGAGVGRGAARPRRQAPRRDGGQPRGGWRSGGARLPVSEATFAIQPKLTPYAIGGLTPISNRLRRHDPAGVAERRV